MDAQSKSTLTPEELRARIVSDIDAALSRPILSRFITATDAALMRAERGYWQEATAEELAKLMTYYNREP